jgi:hypothetical protein
MLVFAPNHGLRAQIVPAQRRPGSPQAQGDAEGRSAVRPVAMSWAQRLKRACSISTSRPMTRRTNMGGFSFGLSKRASRSVSALLQDLEPKVRGGFRHVHTVEI